jgi:hypothetical protein
VFAKPKGHGDSRVRITYLKASAKALRALVTCGKVRLKNQPPLMPLNKSKTPASVAARDCCNGLIAFGRDVESTLIQVDIEAHAHRAALCTLIWAMSSVIVRNAGFNVSEGSKLRALIEAELKGHWSGASVDLDALDRALETTGQAYLLVKDQWSQVRTASSFAEIFVGSLAAEAEVAERLRTMIAPMCAHRLVSEIYRLSDLQTRRAIQWAVMATIVTLCQFSSEGRLMSADAAHVDKYPTDISSDTSSPTRS